MNRCSSSNHYNNNNNPMSTPCSCDLFNTSTNNSFSAMFFNHPNNHHFSSSNSSKVYDQYDDHYTDHFDAYSTTSSVVDCTLSLGTPSTRSSSTTRDHQTNNNKHNQKRSSISKLCSWDIFSQTKKHPNTTTLPSSNNSNSTGRGGSTNNSNGDSLLARRCANCDTTSTPLWRNGPRGPKSLCNACGIRYKKEERRATSTTTSSSSGASTTVIDQPYMMSHHQHTWAHHNQYPAPVTQKEFMFVDQYQDVNDEAAAAAAHGIPFLSWRLNVPERSGLVHDYTC